MWFAGILGISFIIDHQYVTLSIPLSDTGCIWTLVFPTVPLFFVSAPECRDIETAWYDRTYVFSELCSIFQYVIKRWLRALQLKRTAVFIQSTRGH